MSALVVKKDGKYVLVETPFKAKPDIEVGVGGLVGFDVAKTSSVLAGASGSFVLTDVKFDLKNLNFDMDDISNYQRFRSSLGFSIINQNSWGTKINKEGVIVDSRENELLMTLTLDIAYFFLNQPDFSLGVGLNTGGFFHLESDKNQMIAGPNLLLLLYSSSDWPFFVKVGSLMTVIGNENNYILTAGFEVLHNFMK